MSKKLLAVYGLKFNPFTPDIPTEALHTYDKLEHFCWRIEHAFIREGGFALISGDPGTGKSVALRLLEAKLAHVRDIHVGVLTHSSTRISDFYRELGDIFGVPLSPHNLWNSFKQLRERWISHMENSLLRPALFIDEAQEMPAVVLSGLDKLNFTFNFLSLAG
jgi:general secretion pathway protein A